MPADPKLVVAHCDELFKEQVNWRHTWQDVSDYFYPVKANIETLETPGEVRAQERYDYTGEEMLLKAAAGIVGWVTPIGTRWIVLEPKNKKAPQEIKDWFRICSEILLEALASSNFYMSWHEDVIDGLMFGTSCLFIEGGDEKDLNFVSWPISTWAFTMDSEERPDYICRKWDWTARQAVSEWGEENVGEEVLKAYKAGSPDCEKKFTFYHAIYKRKEGEYKEGPTTGDNRPWASVYVSNIDKHLIEEDGYYELPAPIGRILKSNSEKYGRSPSIGTLPVAKMLSRMEYDTLLAIEKMVNPPWIAPDDSDYDPDNRPNGVTYYKAGSKEPKQQEYKNRIDLAEATKAFYRGVIERAFFVDMFQMLTQIGANNRQFPTATQIHGMLEERVGLFTPIFSRLTQEKLNPTIERVFSILFRKGAFPRPPANIAEWGGEYEISYNSRIALAIKSLQNNQLFQAMEFIRGMTEIDPAARYAIKATTATRGALTNMSLPQDWIRDENEIEEMVEAEEQAARMAQTMEIAKTGAEAASKLPQEVIEV